ncbi:hypothetical protein X777_05435 [Ooceraea biroi]|uniref:Uncharacterized protein n=1 Tax=Ooceraea biroi TaxID=2015173 RepID=A0A026X247_OOCBI|nr:hypothetical protein X777_05435 [Ooceraea biroi]
MIPTTQAYPFGALHARQISAGDCGIKSGVSRRGNTESGTIRSARSRKFTASDAPYLGRRTCISARQSDKDDPPTRHTDYPSSRRSSTTSQQFVSTLEATPSNGAFPSFNGISLAAVFSPHGDVMNRIFTVAVTRRCSEDEKLRRNGQGFVNLGGRTPPDK